VTSGSDEGPPRTLVVLIGPPAVGKMAVGRALEDLTGLPLLHNHMTIDLVLPFFEFGSPPFSRLVGGFRQAILDEVASSDLRGMIFTHVWAFGEPGSRDYVDTLIETFADGGGRTVFAELFAPLEVRIARNNTPLRLAEKPSKRDVAASTARLLDADEKYKMNCDGEFPFPQHIRIDTSEVSPEAAAQMIAEAFDLPNLSPDDVSSVKGLEGGDGRVRPR